MASVDIVLPVYNEARVLERSVRALHLFVEDNLRHEWRIVIADNGSQDATFSIAERLAAELSNVSAIHVPAPIQGAPNGLRRGLSPEFVREHLRDVRGGQPINPEFIPRNSKQMQRAI